MNYLVSMYLEFHLRKEMSLGFILVLVLGK